MYRTELYHHGILGQKWGVRRYRNDDGTLTEAGKARYSSDGKKLDPRQMTDAELQKANNRLQMEQNYRQLTGRRSSAENFFNADTAIAIGVGATGAALTVLLANKLNPNPSTGKALTNKVLLSIGTTVIGTTVSRAGGGKKK